TTPATAAVTGTPPLSTRKMRPCRAACGWSTVDISRRPFVSGLCVGLGGCHRRGRSREWAVVLLSCPDLRWLPPAGDGLSFRCSAGTHQDLPGTFEEPIAK